MKNTHEEVYGNLKKMSFGDLFYNDGLIKYPDAEVMRIFLDRVDEKYIDYFSKYLDDERIIEITIENIDSVAEKLALNIIDTATRRVSVEVRNMFDLRNGYLFLYGIEPLKIRNRNIVAVNKVNLLNENTNILITNIHEIPKGIKNISITQQPSIDNLEDDKMYNDGTYDDVEYINMFAFQGTGPIFYEDISKELPFYCSFKMNDVFPNLRFIQVPLLQLEDEEERNKEKDLSEVSDTISKISERIPITLAYVDEIEFSQIKVVTEISP